MVVLGRVDSSVRGRGFVLAYGAPFFGIRASACARRHWLSPDVTFEIRVHGAVAPSERLNCRSVCGGHLMHLSVGYVRSEDADLGEEVRYSRLSWPSPVFDKIMSQAIDRICLFLAKRHKRRRRYGWSMVRLSPNRLGLITIEEPCRSQA